jgi:putative membrane protein
MRLLLMWGVNVAALWVVAVIFDDISYTSVWKLLLAGLVFGIVNSLVRPIVRALLKTVGLPIVVLTFGLVLFLANVLMLYITSWLVSGFEIQSFGAAVLAAIVIAVVQSVLEAAFGLNKSKKS